MDPTLAEIMPPTGAARAGCDRLRGANLQRPRVRARSGLLHRDIKPANILVTKDDVVKAFRLRHRARRLAANDGADQTGPGDGKRVLHFAGAGARTRTSREFRSVQRRHRALSDAYRKASVYGRVAGDGSAQAYRRSGSDDRMRVPASSRRIGAIVNKLLQKRPENRFHSASEVATALREARERPSVAAYQITDDAPTQMIVQRVAAAPLADARSLHLN